MNIEDEVQLVNYLRDLGHLESDETPNVRILAGGVSNKTVLVERKADPDLVIKQALAKLRVKEDWFSDPSRIHREAEGIRLLEKVAPAGMIPPLIFEDEQHHVLGMAAVPEPHVNWKHDLLAGKIDKGVVRQFAQCLGAIHSSFDIDQYPDDGIIQGLDFFESLRLEPYYLFSGEQVPGARAFMQQLVAETRNIKRSLVHGDYSPKNVLVQDRKMVLLDHEVIHLGDPAFDVGFSMTHLLSKAHHLPVFRLAFKEAALLYWREYDACILQTSWREEFEQRAVRHTLGCLMARVAGRSPLEYLTANARQIQLDTVQVLMQRPPATMPQLIDEFLDAAK